MKSMDLVLHPQVIPENIGLCMLRKEHVRIVVSFMFLTHKTFFPQTQFDYSNILIPKLCGKTSPKNQDHDVIFLLSVQGGNVW